MRALTRQGGEQRLLLPAFTPLLKSSDQSLVTITLSSLGQMGPDAVPVVLPLTDDPNSEIQIVALSTLVTLASQSSQVAPQVLPVLLKKMKELDPQQRPMLAGHLQRLGAASVKPLAAELRNPDVSLRRLAVEALRSIGSRGAQQAEPELIAALDDPDLQVRLNCAVTLTQVAKSPPQRITAVLLEGLRDNDLAQRRLAVRMGFPDRYGNPELLSELEKVLTDEDIELVAGAARCLLTHQKTEPVLKQVRRLAAAFGGSAETDIALANVFTTLGPRAKEAIPDLVEKIKQGRSTSEHWVNSSLARIGPTAIPALTVVAAEGSEVQQQRVVSVLQNLGSEGVPAIVELHGSVSPNVRNNILFVLSSKLDQSPAALKLLLAQVESADPATVMVTLSALSNAPSLPREAVAPLRRLLNEARQAPANSPLRSRLTLLMQALSRIGPDAHEAIPDLTVLLTEAEPATPCFAAATILSIDPSHTDAGNVLIQCLDTPATQNIAVHALYKLGLRAQRLVPRLEKYVESSTLPSRGRLVYLLAVCGSQSDSLVSATEELLDSPNHDDRQHAAQTLRWLGPRAQHLLPKLLGHLTAPQDYARFYIVLALPFVAPDAKEVVTVLADLARNDPYLRMPTLMSLAELKDKARSAAEVIAPLLNSDLTYHTLAAATLVLIDPDSHPLAGPMLLDLFERPDSPTSPGLVQANLLIADAVALVAKNSEEARSQIRKGLTHDSFKVRICAARALWKIEGQADAVVPVLLEALDASDASAYSINDVARTLGEIGPPAKAAVPTLLRKARSASIDQQSHVVNALKAIDPAAATAAGYR